MSFKQTTKNEEKYVNELLKPWARETLEKKKKKIYEIKAQQPEFQKRTWVQFRDGNS